MCTEYQVILAKEGCHIGFAAAIRFNTTDWMVGVHILKI